MAANYIRFETRVVMSMVVTKCLITNNLQNKPAVECQRKVIGHFRIVFSQSFSKQVLVLILSYENEISFACKFNSFSYEWLCIRPRFEREALGNSEMVYWFCIYQSTRLLKKPAPFCFSVRSETKTYCDSIPLVCYLFVNCQRASRAKTLGWRGGRE